MRTARLASIILLASGSVLGFPQYPSQNQDSTDGSAAGDGSVSGEFWWQQGGAFGGNSGGSDATEALSNIFNQVVNAFNSSVSQVTPQVTSQVTSGNSVTPTQSEYCALGQGCVPWQLCQLGVITQGSNVEPGKVPYPVGAGYTGCSDVSGNVCCGIPADVLTQQQQNVYDTCSAGLQCVDIGKCNLYNGFIEPQVEQYADQQYVNYNKCTGGGAGESVCCQESPSGPQNPGVPHSNGGSDSSNLNAQCASNQDCVPYFQCYNGEINVDGAGLLDVRTKPKATCSHPEYPDVPAICCRDPSKPELPSVTPPSVTSPSLTPNAPITDYTGSQCDGCKVCVSQGTCDATGNIITDGGGLLDLRIVHKRCTVDETSEVGVCCKPPGCSTATTPSLPVINAVDTCPGTSSCVPELLCSGQALNNGGSMVNYVTGGLWSTCNLAGDYNTPGICCEAPPAPVKEIKPCSGSRVCVDQSQCGKDGSVVTDGSGIFDLRTKSQACYTDEAAYTEGVCCNDTPALPIVDTCPGVSTCVTDFLCTGQVLDSTSNMIAYSPQGSFSQCPIGVNSGVMGVCCINPPPPPPVKVIKPCSGSRVCVDQSQCGQDGSVVTDGSGIFDLRTKSQACYTDEAAYTEGVCCNPPALPIVDTCPGVSTCVPDFLCTGQVLDSTSNMIAYSPQGSFSQCIIGGNSGVMGVCCINPPPLPPIGPIPPANQCGRRNKEEVLDTRIQSIVANNEAQFGEFPWQAIIFFTNYTFKCGASLIGDRWLVTGGHCVNGLKPSEIQIRLGEWQVNSFDEPLAYVDVQVKAITVHPDFNIKNVQNNVAVLELIEPVEIQYHINSICLPAPGQTFPNQRCIISGWGKDSFEGNYQHIIKKVDVPTVDKKTCQALLGKTRLGKWFILHNSFMCAGGEENKDACKGDGGGPLACEDPATGRYYLAGLTSWGIGCGNKDVPGVYADVQGFSTWIQGVIGGTLVQQQQVVGPEVETGSNPYGK